VSARGNDEDPPRAGVVYVALVALAALCPWPTAALEWPPREGHDQDRDQSPLSGGQAALGEGIKLGAQLALEKFKGPLEKMGFVVELVPFDDQAKPTSASRMRRTLSPTRTSSS